jgi:hypothetical protein
MAKTPIKKWLLMKNLPGELENKAQQVYSDKFLEYDYVYNLAVWLNRHNPAWTYWLKEIID